MSPLLPLLWDVFLFDSIVEIIHNLLEADSELGISENG